MKMTWLALLLFLAGCSKGASSANGRHYYVITSFNSVTHNDSNLVEYRYTFSYDGVTNLQTRYQFSQSSSAKTGEENNLEAQVQAVHPHNTYDPDLSQIPAIGTKILACVMDPNHRDHSGGLIIPKQPTPEPCIARIGNVLQFEPSPNGPVFFTFVAFDIVSENMK